MKKVIKTAITIFLFSFIFMFLTLEKTSIETNAQSFTYINENCFSAGTTRAINETVVLRKEDEDCNFNKKYLKLSFGLWNI